MRTKLNKDEFVSMLQTHIMYRREILDFIGNEFLEMLKKFDGKVYNARFINAFKELPCFPHIQVSQKELCEVEIGAYEPTKYRPLEWIAVQIPINKDGRIVADAFEETGDSSRYRKDGENPNSKRMHNYEEYTQTLKKAIETYDEDMKVLEDLEKLIDRANKIQIYTRGNIDSFSHLYI